MTSSKPLHYGIIGLGPVGSTLAAFLQQGGKKTSVLCGYEEKFNALGSRPVTVSGALSARAKITNIYCNLEQFIQTQPDAVFIATKCCDSFKIYEQIAKYNLNEHTVFISCQNGIDVEEQIVQVFGNKRALRLIMNLGGKLENETNVHISFSYTHFLSDIPLVNQNIIKQINDDLNSTSLKVELHPDYKTVVFKKAILNASIGTVCAIAGLTMNVAMEDPNISEIIKSLVRENIIVAQAMGLPIQSSYFDEAIAYLHNGGNHKPSILVDIENKRKTENEYHCGRILYYAKKHGVSAPVNQTVYYFMQTLEKRAMEAT